MKQRWLVKVTMVALVVVASLSATAPAAKGGPITVLNHSFEADVVPRDGNTGTATVNTDDFVVSIVPAGWSGTPSAQLGLLSSADDSLFGPVAGRIANTPDADANDQSVFMNAGGTFYQVLSANVAANTTYTLQVDLGDRTDAPFPASAAIQLGYGGTPSTNLLGGVLSNPTPPSGNWATWSLTVTTGAAPAGLNQPLRIDLVTAAAHPLFDNVRLNSTGGEVIPEPAGLGLIGMALLALRRRRS